VQREADAEVARFATATLLSMQQLRSDLVHLERRNAQLQSANARLVRQLSSIAGRLDPMEGMAGELRSVGPLIEEVNGRMTTLAKQVGSLSEQVPALFERVGVSSAGALSFNYVEFEDRFRGDRSHTLLLQSNYVEQFPPAASSGRVVDIGCGRGEMVEMLLAAGHEVIGIDSDEDMAAACRSRGLPVIAGDGLSWLEAQPAGSLKGIFCSQVVEHLVTPELERFVAGSFAALRDGGIMIIETINPRSWYALANHFFADLSHVRPIHPETLRFMCEQAGFGETLLEERSPHPLMAQLEREDPYSSQSLEDASPTEQLIRTVFGYQDYSLKVIK
jgi:SAM-dependent methyltransferase